MTGLSDTRLDLRWPDATLIAIRISYDAVGLALRETGGREVTVVAEGHIGADLVGFWDEIAIERAEIFEVHPFEEMCRASLAKRLGKPAPDSGSPARNTRRFLTLVVTFADGSEFRCTAAEFVVHGSPESLDTRP